MGIKEIDTTEWRQAQGLEVQGICGSHSQGQN